MSRQTADRFLLFSLQTAAAAAGLVLVSIVLFVGYEALPLLKIKGAGDFLTDSSWHPLEGQFGLGPMLVGTIATSILALVIAGPFGLAAALFEQFYASPAVAQIYRLMIELLAGIPSVVFGLWGLVVLVPLLAQLEPPGTSLLAGALVLAIMILPTVTIFASSAIRALPTDYRRVSAAVGLSTWSHISQIALPAARQGIATGMLLGLARAAGETMIVLLVAGNVVQMPDSLLSSIRTLTSNIALEMAYALDHHRAALFFSGLTVTGLTLCMVLVAGHLRGSDYAR